MPAKGKVNNPKGRTKGSQNKDIAPIRDKFQQLLDGYTVEAMLSDLGQLESVERLRIVTGLAEFIIPKMNRTEVKNEDGNEITIRVVRDGDKHKLKGSP